MIDNPTFKESLVLCVYNFALFLIRLTPKRLVPVVAKGVCFIGRRFVGKDINILRENLEQMRNMPRGSDEALAFEKRTFFNHICAALETLKFSCNPNLMKVDGQEKLAAMVKEGTKSGSGCLIVSAHLGSWETIGWVLSKLSTAQFYALARRPKSKTLTHFFEQFRRRLGTEVLLIDRPLLLREMVKVLKSGAFLAAVMDQRPAGGRKTAVNFLGRKTDFVCGPAIAAQMAKAPVYAIFCVRKGPMHYELISSEVAPLGHGITDTNELTQRMATAIEEAVELYPDQWAWHYDRWRKEEPLLAVSLKPVAPVDRDGLVL